MATFSALSVDRPGSYSLRADAVYTAAGSISSAWSTSFSVTSGIGQLAFTVEPSNVVVGAVISPTVQVTVRDAQGNTDTSATTSITLAFWLNPGGGTLSGTATVAAVKGVATFSNLSIIGPSNNSGTNSALSATATGLAHAVSTFFDVMPKP